MSTEAKQKIAGLFRRGVPEGDQFNLLVCGLLAMLVEKHGKEGTAKLLNAALNGLSSSTKR